MADLTPPRVVYQGDIGSVKVIDQQIKLLKDGISQEEIVMGASQSISSTDKDIAYMLLGGASRTIVKKIGGKFVADNIETATMAIEVKNLRAALRSDNKSSGNMAIANVNIEGLPKTMAAHSAVDEAEKGLIGKGGGNFFAQKIDNISGRSIDRITDSEYKILDNIADVLGNNISTSGRVKILTERPACDSCLGVVEQFMKKYPNIKVEVVDNRGVTLGKKTVVTPSFRDYANGVKK